jgi:GT2 family glycosyltransferase
MPHRVAVVTVTWNSSSFLGDSLDALRNQTLLPQRVIIVDNGSSDANATAKLVNRFPGAEWIPLPTNRGVAFANNLGIAHCPDAEFVALLNPDAFPEPNWLECLVAAAGSHPKAAAFGSRQLRQGSSSILDGVGDHYHISGLVWRGQYGITQRDEHLVMREIFSPCSAAALYRRQALVDVRGFDEDYFCYIDDMDVGFRLRLAGYSAIYVPDAVVHHIGSASSGGRYSDFSTYYGHRNLVWTFVTNMPGVLFWLFLPLHLVLNFVSIFVVTVRGQGRVILRAKWDAILGLASAWAKRKHIQERRIASIREIWRVLDKRLPSQEKQLDA